MTIVVAGGTGFIGRSLVADFVRSGDEVILLTRKVERSSHVGVREIHWDGRTPGEWRLALEGADALVNLSGASIAGGRWTRRRKELLRESRCGTTRLLTEAILHAERRPKVLINGSAIGYYGDVPEGDVTEGSPRGEGFLAELCEEWEGEARRAEGAGVRTVLLRTGIVFGRGGGALARMIPPFRVYAGGAIGSGRQWVSWIHEEDLVRVIRWAVGRGDIVGPLNATAPGPVRMADLARAIGKVLGRPSWLHIPAIAIRLGMGEMADVLLTGQRALPVRLREGGFQFRYSDVESALREVLHPS